MIKDDGNSCIREMTKPHGTKVKAKRQKAKEKLRSADMARSGFQYILKSSQQHTFKLQERSQQNPQKAKTERRQSTIKFPSEKTKITKKTNKLENHESQFSTVH